MTDILGPADAVGAVTDRPVDERTFSTLDSWFKDCSSADAEDGTDLRASFLNDVIAKFRSLWRSNGKLADNVTAIVPEVGSDDNAITKAVQYLIQRGQTNYADDTGAANSIVVTLAPALPEYKKGVRLYVKIAANNTGPTQINVNGRGLRDVTRIDGSPLVQNDLKAGMIAELSDDGVRFQVLNLYNTRPLLTAPADYYVNTATGSDTLNNGITAGTPFKTVTKALAAMSAVDNNGFSVTIHVANTGSYAAGISLPRVNGSGIVYIVGDVAGASCLITGANGGFIAQNGGVYDISGFKFVCSGDAVAADGSGNTVSLSRNDYGTCGGEAHIVAQRGASIVLKGTQQDAGAFTKISGSASRHLLAVSGGTIDIYTQPLTITAPISISAEFARAYRNGSISHPAGTGFSPITNPGNVTGKRFVAMTCGVIDTAGSGANYFPGTVAGVADATTYGVYV